MPLWSLLRPQPSQLLAPPFLHDRALPIPLEVKLPDPTPFALAAAAPSQVRQAKPGRPAKKCFPQPRQWASR